MKQWKIAHIITTVFIATLSISLTIPPHPLLMTRVFTNGDVSKGSQLFGIFMSFYSFLQFFSSPILGRLSDKLQSRRSVLLVQCFASCISFFLLALVAVWGTVQIANESDQYWTLICLAYFLSRLINGVLGNIRMISFTYVGDLSTNGEKATAFGLIGVSIGFAFALGPSLTGILTRYFDQIRFPFVTAFLLQVVCLLYVWNFVEESWSNKDMRSSYFNDDSRLNLMSIIREANPFNSFSLLFSSSATLRKLSMVVFMYGLGNSGFFSVWINYATLRYKFTSFENGLFLTGTSLGYSVCQGLVMKPFVSLVGDKRATLIALLTASLGNFGLAAGNTGWMAYLCIPLCSFASLSGPLANSLACKQVDDSSQGTLQGALSSLTTLSAVLSPLILSYLFSTFSVDPVLPYGLQGAPFYFCSLSIFISFSILYFI